MSWGTELWDQFDNVSVHAQKGILFCEKFVSFTKERIDLENEYASKLKKLVKNHQPKKKEEEDYDFTWAKGYLAMLKEIHDIAGQHEVVAENLNNNVVKLLQSLIQELKSEKKKCSQDESKHSNSLQHSLYQLEKTKKQYERTFKDAEKGVESHKKADADQNLSRAEVDKAKYTMHQKLGQCEGCKKEYAADLQKTNQTQQNHYNNLMPQVFQQMEDVDRRRIGQISDYIKYSAEVERNVIPIVNTCIDGIVNAAKSVNTNEDVRLVVEKYKSGFPMPVDHEFDDLGEPGSMGNNTQAQHSTPKSVQRSETMKASGTQSGKTKQRKGLFGIFSSSKQTDESKEDFSHLPPQQQKKKLQEKLDKIHDRIKNKTGERDGLQKLRDVYVQNSALGDPKTLDSQLETNAQELDNLQQALQKYEMYLAEAGQIQLDAHNSIQRKMSNRSINSSNTGSNPGTPVQMRSNNTPGRVSPDSGVDSNLNQQQSYNDDDSFEGEIDDDFKVVGSATAMYSFDAPNEGSLPMKEGEIFQVLEVDLGDGWTRVRKCSGDEGFVPTSYIQVKLES